MGAFREPSAIRGYHAHVYYDAQSRERAARLLEALDARFEIVLGRWPDVPVGPHPQSMYQVAFAAKALPDIVPWLMLNRDGRVILIHPETGDDYTDHAEHALWLGDRLDVDLDVLL